MLYYRRCAAAPMPTHACRHSHTLACASGAQRSFVQQRAEVKGTVAHALRMLLQKDQLLAMLLCCQGACRNIAVVCRCEGVHLAQLVERARVHLLAP